MLAKISRYNTVQENCGALSESPITKPLEIIFEGVGIQEPI